MTDQYLSESELKKRHSEEKAELYRQLEEKNQILENYKREHGKLEVFISKVTKHIKPLTALSSQMNKIPKPAKKDYQIEAVKHITDSHMGACQEANEIENFNQFNSQICENRNLGFTSAFLNWIDLHRNLYKINEFHVLMTGDLISGDIKEELRVTNEFPTPEQVVRAAELHSQQIALIAPHACKVNIHFISEDNHARLTKKPQSKEGGKNSLNYLIGKLMEAYLAKQKNVEFNLYPMMEKVVTVGGWNYLIKHGHDVKGWMGIPWYGIERSAGREATVRQNLMMQDLEKARKIGYHKIIMGHFHTPFNHWLYSCGGAISGTDAYDHKNGRYSEPSQSAWMVHPKYGEFNRTDFQLKFFDE